LAAVFFTATAKTLANRFRLIVIKIVLLVVGTIPFFAIGQAAAWGYYFYKDSISPIWFFPYTASLLLSYVLCVLLMFYLERKKTYVFF